MVHHHLTFTGLVLGTVTSALTSLILPSPESVFAIFSMAAMGLAAVWKRNADAKAEALLVLTRAEVAAGKLREDAANEAAIGKAHTEVERLRILDEAAKGSTTARLETALAQLADAEARIEENHAELAELRSEVKAITAQLSHSEAEAQRYLMLFLQARRVFAVPHSNGEPPPVEAVSPCPETPSA